MSRDSQMSTAETTMTTAAGTDASFGALKQIDAGLLSVGYAEAGPPDSPAVILLHGWPYWGARTAGVMAALWPERCRAIVSVSGYLIGSPEANKTPLPPTAELQWWYQFYFATERGRAGYERYRNDVANEDLERRLAQAPTHRGGWCRARPAPGSPPGLRRGRRRGRRLLIGARP